VEEEVPGNGGWAKDGEAEEPARVAGESAAGRKGTRRSEKAKVSEEALLTRSSKAKKPTNACVHTYRNHNHQAHGDAAPAGEYMEV
jgi:hypothetical protein